MNGTILMQIFLMTAHLIIVIGLVCTILIQSSDSSAFGTSSSFTSVRSIAHSLARFTSILAFLFFSTSIALGITSRYHSIKTKEDLRQSLASATNNKINYNSGNSNPNIDSSVLEKKNYPSKKNSLPLSSHVK